MGFLQTIQKALHESLAVQQRAALVEILRQRAPTMTFADLQEVLSSPVGKTLGAIQIAEVFGTPSQPLAEPVAIAPTRKKASKAKAKAPEPEPAILEVASEAPRGGKRKAKAKATKARAPKAAPSAGKRSPPGVSAEKRAEIDRYDNEVLNTLREAGGWLSAGDVRPRVGGTAETLRLAFKRLAERKALVREGERASTRYKIAG